MTGILRGAQALESPLAGGKARALARAERAGLPVPGWFVFAASDVSDRLTSAQRAALESAVEKLCPGGEAVAVRSSAGDEDGATHSFAGQLESFLNVAPRDVADRVLDVWRSAFTPRVRAYRRQHGLSETSRPPGVLVQRMIVARAAGVAFSADPVSGRRGVVVVSAVRGLGSALVSGEAEADTWLIDRTGSIVERRIACKHTMEVANPLASGGVLTVNVPADLGDVPALSDEEVLAVGRLARAAERCSCRPQDVEWAVADGLLLLQLRPITSLHALPDPDAPLTIWDNSNIVESYSGVTTPLTFSFAAEVYPPVYRQFCRMMGVSEPTIEQHQQTFQNMLGCIRGRLYYNLLNWHRMLALLPGYRINRTFMEQMMGVKEPLPAEVAEEVEESTARGRVRDAIRFARAVTGLLVNLITIDRKVENFYRRFDEALAGPTPALEQRQADELVAHYRELRRRLLLHWDAPIVNDFFAMIFYGLLRRLSDRWFASADAGLPNDLIAGDGGIVSAEPAVRLQRLARLASRDAALVQRLRTGHSKEIVDLLAAHPELLEEYLGYLAKFGERTVNELKLESETLHDDPLPLFRAIGALASQQMSARDEAALTSQLSAGERLREAARTRVASSLALHPLRRLVFAWVLRHARHRVRDRENLRFERTRLFGRVRRIFLELGRRLYALNTLDDPRDVLYLEVEEILAFFDGRSTCTDLRSIAALRKREFDSYRDQPAPPDRFETRGTVYVGHDVSRLPQSKSQSSDEYRGLGCSPGTVQGPVRIVTDPRNVDLSVRSILVAAHTDPGWIMLFPSAAGVIVERGSLLSHAAIVARELGIPAIVSAAGITSWLADGDYVEMDGAAGTIRRIARSAGERCA